MTNHDPNIAVGLGRVEGKLDAFLSMQADQGKRITAVENDIASLSTSVTTLEATKAQGHSWLSTGLSILAVVITAAGLFFTGGFNG